MGELCIYQNSCNASIEFVIQKTFINIDEAGVEAAAVTALGVVESASRPTEQPLLFLADRPFQFFVYDSTTNLFLFEGRVVDPAPPAGAPISSLMDKTHKDADFWSGSPFDVDPILVSSSETSAASAGQSLGTLSALTAGLVFLLQCV